LVCGSDGTVLVESDVRNHSWRYEFFAKFLLTIETRSRNILDIDGVAPQLVGLLCFHGQSFTSFQEGGKFTMAAKKKAAKKKKKH
jgi:hypothetical protein